VGDAAKARADRSDRLTVAPPSGSEMPRRYVPLVYRVAGMNAVLLVAAVVVTLLVLAPRRLSMFALDEAVILLAALGLVALVNLMILRRVVRPLEALTALARRVDLLGPGERIPHAEPTSEAGELSLTFNEMLTRLEVERREATGRFLAGQEAERLRIAQELHDQVGQDLTAVLLGLARVHARLEPPLREDVSDVQEAVRTSLEDVRRIALELRPEALDDLGLDVSLQIDERLPAVEPDAELVIYRVAQEALTNVARHSGAAHSRLSLECDDSDGLVMTVADDGRGMPAGGEPGTGIRGMLERAALIGARLELTPGPEGRGSSVALRISSASAPEAGAAV
jgi:two-component system sensor histidine kinase UhpB